MANKVLWDTGDTITADKLNGSGVFVVPLTAGEGAGDYTSTTTAKEVADALTAGCLIVAVDCDRGEAGIYVSQNVCAMAEMDASSNTVMIMWASPTGEPVSLTAEYPDGTFTSSGDK